MVKWRQMKPWLLFASILFFSFSGHAEGKPKIDWDVKTVISTDPSLPKNVHSGIRYRAIISSAVENETPTYLTIEKIREPLAAGSPYTLEWSKRVEIPELDKVKSETGYLGDFTSLKWVDKSFSFHIPLRKKLNCVIKDVEEAPLKAACK